jgi:hypothetical protein
MTYEELKQLRPGTLVRVKGGAYDYMFLQGVCPHDRTIRVEMNGVNQRVDPSEDTRFNQVVEFIEKLK